MWCMSARHYDIEVWCLAGINYDSEFHDAVDYIEFEVRRWSGDTAPYIDWEYLPSYATR